MVVIVFIFLKHSGLFGRLADSNYFYTEESIPYINNEFPFTRNSLEFSWKPGGAIFQKFYIGGT